MKIKQMKIIYNSIIPFKGFIAINLFGVLFVRKEYKGKIDKSTLNHESIHTAQMKELFYIPFYILYFLEWVANCIVCRNMIIAYYNISFEKEAFANEVNYEYLSTRKRFAQWRKLYIK